MLSQLAQWQRSRKGFVLLATHQQWKEKFQQQNSTLFGDLFENLLAFEQ